jgi:nitronate monooxygenase
VNSGADDIVYSSLFTGVSGNYLRGSIQNAGMDPDNLPEGDLKTMNFGDTREKPKAWKTIWGSGQGIGAVKDVLPVAALVDRFEREFEDAWARLRERLE